VSLRALVRRLVPRGVRLRVRALLERDAVDPGDVDRVKAVTAAHWQSRGARYVDAYWDDIDAGGASAVSRGRSEWLADLPPIRQAASVMELGCGPGRNLWVLQQRRPDLALYGLDINPEAIAKARRHVRGDFGVGDLYALASLLGERTVDVIFTMGVLIHLHPRTLPGVIAEMRRRARRHLVFVEQISADDEVVKGPAGWGPTRTVSGEYIQWSPNLPRILDGHGLRYALSDVPPALQSNGARHLLVVDLA
jgi:SAM-dependent methyltransferase